jgi:hypothetical protein
MVTKLLSHMYVARWSDTTLMSKLSWAHCTRDCSYKALRHRQNGIGVFCLNLSPWMTYASKFSNSLPETSFRPSNPMISFCNCGITLTLSPFTMRCVPLGKDHGHDTGPPTSAQFAAKSVSLPCHLYIQRDWTYWSLVTSWYSVCTSSGRYSIPSCSHEGRVGYYRPCYVVD